jgi:hypothetical protein
MNARFCENYIDRMFKPLVAFETLFENRTGCVCLEFIFFERASIQLYCGR